MLQLSTDVGRSPHINVEPLCLTHSSLASLRCLGLAPETARGHDIVVHLPRQFFAKAPSDKILSDQVGRVLLSGRSWLGYHQLWGTPRLFT